MEVWKIIFLSKWVICRLHVNLPGCSVIVPSGSKDMGSPSPGWPGKHRLHRLRKEWSFHKVPRSGGNMGSLKIFKMTHIGGGESKNAQMD